MSDGPGSQPSQKQWRDELKLMRERAKERRSGVIINPLVRCDNFYPLEPDYARVLIDLLNAFDEARMGETSNNDLTA